VRLPSRKKYFSESAWDKLMELRKRTEDHSAQWQARVDLFRDIEAALGEDPGGEKAQELAARWQAQIEEASGGDPEIKLGLLAGWSPPIFWIGPSQPLRRRIRNDAKRPRSHVLTLTVGLYSPMEEFNPRHYYSE
jgi:TipAS antibiotic-recognition domain